MKRKKIFALIAGGTALSGGFVWARHEASRQVYHLKNGLTVEILPVGSNDVADVLGMNRWKFHITMPPHANCLQTTLGVRRTDKPLPSEGWTVMPVEENEFDVSVVLHTEHGKWQDDPQVNGWFKYGNLSMQTQTKNPFRRQKSEVFSGIGTSNPMEMEDDTFVFMSSMVEQPNKDGINAVPYIPYRFAKIVVKWEPYYAEGASPPPKHGFWQSVFAPWIHR